ncbi:hypothetical protein DDB_G0272152 [Dictyostelium discoideum AX4]|uniref:MICOS complex subunit n=1 Tax=Dictyostelium discoideum TaxID=44689 RepID=Q75JT7_DICDI|nr:hypothetical protein DDB_G0272152 [Dictyostelium discoideum AX4]EAL71228.1 hypothetical protein DDB_G0272152 [Dictyostelium discoideum AX4]|eukprot:XP_645255.1 hypothetical protein DDB_G0272152 [Dictyostelium discoideum AX4]
MSDKRDDEHQIFTPIARGIIETIDNSKELKKETCILVDKSIKNVSKLLVNEYESPIYRNSFDDFKTYINKSNPYLVVAGSTLIPYLITKPKFLKLRPISFGLVGLSTSLYYCFPNEVSMAAKKSVDYYNEFKENF